MRKASTATVRRDIYAEVTASIIADLEKGCAPWVRPWSSETPAAVMDLPRNAATSRPYSGINILILWASARGNCFLSSRWMTFNQARDAGGCVKKGSKGTSIVYASTFIPDAEKAKGDDAKSIAFLKSFTVFNLDQIEGCDQLRGAAQPLTVCERNAMADALVESSGVDFRIGGDQAFYVPSQDYIQVPPQSAFHDSINYYRTVFHELGHATGHKSRLDRKLNTNSRTHGYAREELVAELCAAFVCATIEIEPTVRHADYIATWITVLKEDDRAIFRAASAASKAADWIMNREPVEIAMAA